MRVLLLHNRYRRQSGEERAVGDIATLLARRGHTVEVLERSSEGVGRGRAAQGLLGGGVDPDEVGDAVRRMRAEVVHVHNVHPLFGWRALAAAQAGGARTVMHLHNFRLFCAIAVAYRDGERCFRCRGANTLAGLRLRCRGSVGEAAVYAAGLSRQQARLFEHTDRFLAVSQATLERLWGLGLPGSGAAGGGRAVALPNFVLAEGFASDSRADQGDYALVSGRLVEEKGFDTAIAAARAVGVPLVVAGAGPDEGRLRALAEGTVSGSSSESGSGSASAVRFVGHVSGRELASLRAGAGAVLVPSRWEEPCPYSALDALAAGVPVLASGLGGLPELVGDGVVRGAGEGAPPASSQGEVAAWADALHELWRDPELRLARGRAELARARERFGEDRYHEGLMKVYSGEVAETPGGRPRLGERA